MNDPIVLHEGQRREYLTHDANDEWQRQSISAFDGLLDPPK